MDMQQDLNLPGGHVYASYGFGQEMGEADAEAEADEEGYIGSFEIEGVGDGFSLATGMAVTARIVERLVNRVARCMVAFGWLYGVCIESDLGY
jgi:hypothetical protein